MNTIQPNLRPGDANQAVADLQAALLMLLRSGAIPTESDDERTKVANLVFDERIAQTFGDATAELVVRFRRARDLPGEPPETVDQAVADAINALLERNGVFGPAAASPITYTVTGQITFDDGRPFPQATVRVEQLEAGQRIRLALDTTDADGRYTARFQLPADSAPIRFTVTIPDADQPDQTPAPLLNLSPVVTCHRTIPTGARKISRTIAGRVRYPSGMPPGVLTLRLRMVGFGGAIGSTFDQATNADGQFSFRYPATDRAARLDICIATKPDNQPEVISDPIAIFNDDPSTPELVLELTIPSPDETTEFARLAESLKPFVGDIGNLKDAKERPEQRDITLLSRATGWDARLIALAATAADRTTGDLTQEALYGLFRAGYPIEPEQLAQLDPADVTSALDLASRSRVIGKPNHDAIGVSLATARDQLITRAIPGSTATYAAMLDTLDSERVSDAQKATFAQIAFTTSEGSLWDAARAQGIPDAAITSLRRQGKVAFLTSNSVAVTASLQGELESKDKSPSWFAHEGLFTTDAWLTKLDQIDDVVAAVPEPFLQLDAEGNIDAVASKTAFADDLAYKIRVGYPTHVIAYKVGDPAEGFPLGAEREQTKEVLLAAADRGFRFGQAGAKMFLAQNADLLESIPEGGTRTAVTDQILTLQRAHQLASSDDGVRTLMDLGMTHASDIASYSEIEWIGEFAQHFPSKNEPKLIHRKATQINAISLSLFAAARNLESAPPIAAVPGGGPQIQALRNDLTTQYPNMESLFGPLEFCECTHCRSVLSPAAYLVDLLAFIDKPPVKGTPGATSAHNPYEILEQRRPDLAHLQLTCDNTNVALPYIDLVNEVFEYVVAQRKLTAESVHDIEDGETSADLLAEPRHVVAAAYDLLAGERYPRVLPFDRPLALARAMVGIKGIALWQVVDTLASPGAPNAKDQWRLLVENLGLTPSLAEYLTDPMLLAGGAWQALYGFPSFDETTGPAIQQIATTQELDANGSPTGVFSTTLAIPHDVAARLFPGDAYTWFDTSTGTLASEPLTLSSVGNLGTNAPTTLTFQGQWSPAPENGDLLVPFDVLGQLAEAPKLAGRLEVSYVDLAAIIETRFVNPGLHTAVIKTGANPPVEMTMFDLFREGLSISMLRQLTVASEMERLDKHRDLLKKIDALGPQEKLAAADQKVADDLSKDGTLEYLQGLAWTELRVAQEQIPLDSIPFDQVLDFRSTPDSSFAFTTLQYADGTQPNAIVFARIALFARLQHALGWSIKDLDVALGVIHGAPLTREAIEQSDIQRMLIRLSQIRFVEQQLELDERARQEYLTLWGDLQVTGRETLYDRRFRSADAMRITHVFDKPDAPYRVQVKDEDTSARMVLQSALRLNADEIELIRVATQRVENPPAPDDRSVREVTSALMRHAFLARVLDLTIDDYLALRQLYSTELFDLTLPDAAAVLPGRRFPWSNLAEFITIARELSELDLSPEALSRLSVNNAASANAPAADDFDLLRTIVAGMREIRAQWTATSSDSAQITDELLRNALELLVPREVAAAIVQTLVKPDAAKLLQDRFRKAYGADLTLATGEGLAFGLFDAAAVAQLFDDTAEEPRRNALAAIVFPKVLDRLLADHVSIGVADGSDLARELVQPLVTESGWFDQDASLLAGLTAASQVGLAVIFRDGNGKPVHDDIRQDLVLIKKERPAGAKTLEATGYFEASASGTYRFTVSAASAGKATAELTFPDLPDAHPLSLELPESGATIEVDLPGNVLTKVEVKATGLDKTDITFEVQSSTMTRGSIARLTPMPLSLTEHANAMVHRLADNAPLITTLDLSIDELRELRKRSWLDFTAPPPNDGGNPPAPDRFAGFLEIVRYVRLREDIGVSRTDAIALLTGDWAAAIELIGSVIDRDTSQLTSLHSALFGGAEPPFDLDHLERFWSAVQLAARFDRYDKTLPEIATILADSQQDRSKNADRLHNLVQSDYAPESWRRVAKPLFDTLRQQQRDALVAYAKRVHGSDSLEDLYEWYLIDPGMEPVVQTSRIRLAIASVQLFIQRCLLNLEPHVRPKQISALQWEWMKRYRVWEANRKIFLYPENWLEPEFRDDKSHLFRQLEGTLLQGDVSDDLVEDAFFAYLTGLEELAKLHILAVHLDHDSDSGRRTVHVVARTQHQPTHYFYRTYENGEWSPWEPIATDVQGDHVAPVVWRNRLYLFWVTFLVQPKKTEPKAPMPDGELAKMTGSDLNPVVSTALQQKVYEIYLHWSELIDGEWSTSVSPGLDQAIIHEPKSATADGKSLNFDSIPISVARDAGDSSNGAVYINLGGAVSRAFQLVGRNAKVRNVDPVSVPVNDLSTTVAGPTRFLGDGGNLAVTFAGTATLKNGKVVAAQATSHPILSNQPGIEIIPCNSVYTDAAAVSATTGGDPDELVRLLLPFFVEDDHQAFFVLPHVEERTVESVEGWLRHTQPPQKLKPADPDPDHFVIPQYYEKPVIPKPLDPISRFEFESVIDVDTGFLGDHVGFEFDGTVIGPRGGLDYTITREAALPGQPAVLAGQARLGRFQPQPGAFGQLDVTPTLQTDLVVVNGSGLSQALGVVDSVSGTLAPVVAFERLTRLGPG